MELSRPPARPRLYQGQVKKKSRGLILGAPCPRVTSSVSCLVNKQLRRGELTPPDAGLRAPQSPRYQRRTAAATAHVGTSSRLPGTLRPSVPLPPRSVATMAARALA